MQDTIGIVLNNGEVWYFKYLLPAILTLLIGIISFFISQIYIRYLDKIRSREKYLGYLRVIREEVKRNLDLLCQSHAYLYVQLLPSFQLSFFVGDEIFSSISTICLNYGLLNEIFSRYFDYKHIQDRLNRLSKMSNELDEIGAQNPVNQNRKHSIEGLLKSELGGTYKLIAGNIGNSFNTYNQISTEINLWDKKAKLGGLSKDYLKSKYDEFQNTADVLNALKQLEKLGYMIDLNNRPKFYE